LEELEAVSPSRKDKEWRGYSVTDTPNVKRDQLAYFALSVFWRAAVHCWPTADGKGKTNKLELGAVNTEALRRFLRGEGPMPSTMALFFVVLTDRLSQATLYFPTAIEQEGLSLGIRVLRVRVYVHSHSWQTFGLSKYRRLSNKITRPMDMGSRR